MRQERSEKWIYPENVYFVFSIKGIKVTFLNVSYILID